MDSIGDKSETPVETAPAASETAPSTSETALAASETATKVKLSSDPIQIQNKIPHMGVICAIIGLNQQSLQYIICFSSKRCFHMAANMKMN